MGNVRSDARAKGQHTRLQARAIVLERGGTKVALVVTELCCVPGGLITEVAALLDERGIDEQSMVVAGTHTHSAPGQYFPYSTHNTVFPNVPTPTEFAVRPDPQLYGFLARQVAKAVARADDDLAPGAAAWGHAEIPVGLTQNRSIEAHLANFGIQRDLGEGRASESPEGAAGTIDPDLEVLRVDKRIGGDLVPVGLWTTFANHGTVTLGKLAENYNGDHLGAAMLATEAELRRTSPTPRRQDLVVAFSNADEGDASSALHRTGPAAAEYVGRVEAAAMLRAWDEAGRAALVHARAGPALDAFLLLRPDDRGRPRRRQGRPRAAPADRVRRAPRTAARQHRRGLRGLPAPGGGLAPRAPRSRSSRRARSCPSPHRWRSCASATAW